MKRKKARRAGRKRPGGTKLTAMLAAALLIASVFFALYGVDRKILPIMIEIAGANVKTRINAFIAESVNDYSRENGLKSEDFYIKSADSNGRISALSVNSVLVNDMCAKIAADVSAGLANLSPEDVAVPVGALLGFGPLANRGPALSVKILPHGSASVDYETSFASAGINQVNYQIWLKVSAAAEIVNPFRDAPITIERKIMLVNTLITGEIPGFYFQRD